MEQLDERTGLRIYGREVGAFVQIAVVTGERQIFRIITAAMLTRHDVLDVKFVERLRALRKPAVLATIARPLPDEYPCRRIHHAARPS